MAHFQNSSILGTIPRIGVPEGSLESHCLVREMDRWTLEARKESVDQSDVSPCVLGLTSGAAQSRLSFLALCSGIAPGKVLPQREVSG